MTTQETTKLYPGGGTENYLTIQHTLATKKQNIFALFFFFPTRRHTCIFTVTYLELYEDKTLYGRFFIQQMYIYLSVSCPVLVLFAVYTWIDMISIFYFENPSEPQTNAM